jgi:hypothetical protein
MYDPRDLPSGSQWPLTTDLDQEDDGAAYAPSSTMESRKKEFGMSTYKSLQLAVARRNRLIYSTQFEPASGLVGIPKDEYLVLDKGGIKRPTLKNREDERLCLPLWRLPPLNFIPSTGFDWSWFALLPQAKATHTRSYLPSGLSQEPAIAMFNFFPHNDGDTYQQFSHSDRPEGSEYLGLVGSVKTSSNGTGGHIHPEWEPSWVGSYGTNDATNYPTLFTNPLGPSCGRHSWTYKLRHHNPVVTHFDYPEYQKASRGTQPNTGPGPNVMVRPAHELAFMPYGFSLEFGVPSSVVRGSLRTGDGYTGLQIYSDTGTPGTVVNPTWVNSTWGSPSQTLAVRAGAIGGMQYARLIGTTWVKFESMPQLCDWAERTAFDEYHLRGFMSYGGMPWLLPWHRGRIGPERVSDSAVIPLSFPGNNGQVARGFAADAWDYYVPRYVGNYDSSGKPINTLPSSYWLGGIQTDAFKTSVKAGDTGATFSRVGLDAERVEQRLDTDPVAGYLQDPQPVVHQPVIITHSLSTGNVQTDYGGEFYPGGDSAASFDHGDEHADYETYLHMRKPTERPRGLRDFKIKRVRDVIVPPRQDNNTGVSMKRRSWFWRINDVITFDNEEAWSLDKAYMLHTFGSSTRASAAVEVEWVFRDIDEMAYNDDEYQPYHTARNDTSHVL